MPETKCSGISFYGQILLLLGSKNIDVVTNNNSGIPVILMLLIFSALILNGCTEDGCYEEVDSKAGLTIFDPVSGNSVPTDSLTLYGTGPVTDTLYLNKSLKILYLPPDPAREAVSFVLVNGLVADTVTISYSSEYNFVSKACGYNFLYTLQGLSYTRHRLDTILVINKKITPADEENIRAFY